MNTMSGILALAGGLAAGVASTATAEQLCVEYLRVRGEHVDINYDSSASYDATNREGGNNSLCGLLFFETVSGGSITAFCAEFSQPISPDTEYCFDETAVKDLPGPGGSVGEAKAMAIQNHYWQNYSQIDTVTGDNTVANTAFQIVLWELVEENWNGTNTSELSLSLGAMQFNGLSSDVENAANLMISNLDLGNLMSLKGWNDPTTQDIITVTVVPGPSIALAGVIGLAGIRRRRR